MGCDVRSYNFTSVRGIGRFTQTDPILGNRPGKHYAYAANCPTDRKDPLGLDEFRIEQDPNSGLQIVKYINEGLFWIDDDPVDVGVYDPKSEQVYLFKQGSQMVSVPYNVLERGLKGVFFNTGSSTTEGWYDWAKGWRDSQPESAFSRKGTYGALHQELVRPPNWENQYQGFVQAVHDAGWDVVTELFPQGKALHGLSAMVGILGKAKKAKQVAKIIRTTEKLASRGGHHVFPKYLGGAHLQTLAKIPKSAHDALHAALDAYDGGIFRRFKGGDAIRGDYSFEQIVGKLRKFYRDFDGGNYAKLFEQALEETKLQK
jgi:hypothetical protein